MKHTLKNILTIVLLLLFTFCNTTSALAYETPTKLSVCTAEMYSSSGNVYPYPAGHQVLTTNTSWQTIAYSTKGFNCNVYVKCNNTATVGLKVVPCDVQMLDKNGNVLWSENGAIAGLGSRTFWCGSDVYKIQIRTQAGKGTAFAYEA